MASQSVVPLAELVPAVAAGLAIPLVLAVQVVELPAVAWVTARASVSPVWVRWVEAPFPVLASDFALALEKPETEKAVTPKPAHRSATGRRI